MDNSFKVWGKKIRLLEDEKNEVDLLYLKENSFCSSHTHENKINRFYLITGKVKIETELGSTILSPNEIWTVYPKIKHRFVVLEPSILIEMAYVYKGRINPDDIIRESQGGLMIDGKEITLDEMREKGLLEL